MRNEFTAGSNGQALVRCVLSGDSGANGQGKTKAAASGCRRDRVILEDRRKDGSGAHPRRRAERRSSSVKRGDLLRHLRKHGATGNARTIALAFANP
jgi:hypothetical protein